MMHSRRRTGGLAAMFMPLILALTLLANVLLFAVPSSGEAWAHYVATLYHQIDGSPYQHSNCTLANLTTAMDTVSGGYWRIPASILRKMSGDTQGGLTYDQIVALAPQATKGEVKVTRLYWMPTSDIVTLLKAPRTVHISILCSETINTPYHTGYFIGRHNIGLYDLRLWTDADTQRSTWQVLVGDPGTSSDFRWWPLSLVIRAAQASTGKAGTCHVWYSADLEGVTRVTRTKLTVHSKPALHSTDATSHDLGTILAGKPVTVVSTAQGGPWHVVTDGVNHPGNGWSKIKYGTGYGWVLGGRLKAA